MLAHKPDVGYALRDLPDLESKVERRRREISSVDSMDEWRRDVFHVRFPPRRKGPLTPPTRTHLPGMPPLSRRSPERVSEDEVLSYLSNSHTMIGKQFAHSPPQGQDQDSDGMWEVISYTVKKADIGPGINHEYQVLLQTFGEYPVAMNKEEVRYLLQYSTAV